jgi:hypothetical protein
LGRPINVSEVDNLGNLGETSCDLNPVLIKIRSGLDAQLGEQVLAHELGHALICGRGVVSNTMSYPPTDGMLSIVLGLGNEIGSCYIDPLADAEAEKRGFKPAQPVDELLRRSTSHSKEEIQEYLKKYGDLAADLTALAIYCTDLRPHSFQISQMEAPISHEPAIMTKLQALRHDLGRPKCFDSSSCFVLTKSLRDAFALQKLVTVKNPTTGVFE